VFRFPAEACRLLYLQNFQTVSGAHQPASRAHPACYLICDGGAFRGDKTAWCVNVASKFYGVPNLTMRGTVFPLSHSPLWCADGYSLQC
jgi:hypothetical protein